MSEQDLQFETEHQDFDEFRPNVERTASDLRKHLLNELIAGKEEKQAKPPAL
jgi:hypothetical protein